MRHELKSWPSFFEPILQGVKTFEIRENDRKFSTGDEIWLREWCTEKKYSGRSLEARISYIFDTPMLGLEKGYICFSLLNIKRLGDTKGG